MYVLTQTQICTRDSIYLDTHVTSIEPFISITRSNLLVLTGMCLTINLSARAIQLNLDCQTVFFYSRWVTRENLSLLHLLRERSLEQSLKAQRHFSHLVVPGSTHGRMKSKGVIVISCADSLYLHIS